MPRLGVVIGHVLREVHAIQRELDCDWAMACRMYVRGLRAVFAEVEGAEEDASEASR